MFDEYVDHVKDTCFVCGSRSHVARECPPMLQLAADFKAGSVPSNSTRSSLFCGICFSFNNPRSTPGWESHTDVRCWHASEFFTPATPKKETAGRLEPATPEEVEETQKVLESLRQRKAEKMRLEEEEEEAKAFPSIDRKYTKSDEKRAKHEKERDLREVALTSEYIDREEERRRNAFAIEQHNRRIEIEELEREIATQEGKYEDEL